MQKKIRVGLRVDVEQRIYKAIISINKMKPADI